MNLANMSGFSMTTNRIYPTSTPSTPSTLVSVDQINEIEIAEEPAKPTIDGLKKILGNTENREIVQDDLNRHIFTISEGNEKAYWFLNIITGQYQLLANYSLKIDDNSSTTLERKDMGRGTINTVYPRLSTDTIAIRRLHNLDRDEMKVAERIKESNLMLSLLYSMPNHDEILKSINIGFIKSSKQQGLGWKTIVPAIQGGTLTQMFGTNFRGPNYFSKSYGRCYGIVSHRHKKTVEIAKRYHEEDLQNKKPLADDLKKSYQEFCEHAKTQGYFINHDDITPYNVMYNNKDRCLTLIDGDSWRRVSDEKAMGANLDEEFKEVAKHH